MCPARCYCNDDELRASCSGAGLQVVPIQLNPEVKYISLSHNKINNVHFTLEIYADLNTLDISFNKIQKLGSLNFQSQRHLNHLDLSNNNIESLDKDVFKGLKSLRTLNLSFNDIENIAINSFHDLHQLETLKMSDNRIISFEDDLLKHTAKLKILILDNNQILDIPSENLKYTTKLEELSLASNLVKNIDKGSFPHLVSLNYLSLAINVISDVHPNSFDGFAALEFLDLSNNNFTSVLTSQLSKLSNLTELNLSGNYFTAIPPVAFRGLFKLERLYLNEMSLLSKIDARAFVDNIKLENISLDDNKGIKTIPTRLFYGNPRVLHISMVNNGLSTVESSHFPLDQLHTLRLAGNPFVCNCSLMWLWKLELEQRSKQNESDITLDINRISCTGPKELENKLLVDVPESDIRCSLSWIAVAALSTASTCLLFILLVVLFYVKRIKCGKETAMSGRERATRESSLYQNGSTVTCEPRQECNEKFGMNTPVVHEYRALSPWENAPAYEHYGYSTSRMYHTSKPHIVYV